ncbi:MAG: Helix-turn-helix domain protein [Mucilaginibacter sp.]|nr:Helix-turn-helix domain protein [Mucilaginibacter sp.]
MSKTIKTSYTDLEFRQLIRDEVQTVLNNIPGMPKVEVNEGYLTVKQAAEFIKIVPGSLYNLISQNKVPYHKNGKRVLFKRSELATWLLNGPDIL